VMWVTEAAGLGMPGAEGYGNTESQGPPHARQVVPVAASRDRDSIRLTGPLRSFLIATNYSCLSGYTKRRTPTSATQFASAEKSIKSIHRPLTHRR